MGSRDYVRKRKWGGRGDVLAAEVHFADVAKDLVKYYAQNVFPDCFKEPVVSSAACSVIHCRGAIVEALG